MPSSLYKGSVGRPWRQFLVASVLIILTACASEEEAQRGTIGFVEGFIGGVAADEPRAVLIGRDVLSAGGSAADAATAVYFALSVTMPSSASLGGGGVCVVRNAVDQTTRTLDFLARAPQEIPRGAARPSAIPGNPRGFFALHSKLGRLRWEELVGPAETLARFGSPVSRAFANDLAQVERALLAEVPSRRIFGHSSGQRVLREGETMVQVELASVLGRLRHEGPGAFYGGTMTRSFIDAVADAGGTLSADDLRAYRPVWRDTITVPFGNFTAHFASPPGAAGGVAAQMWGMLSDEDRFADAAEDERQHLLAETALRAFADRGQWLQPDGTSSIPSAELAAPARIERLMASYGANRHLPAAQLNPPPVERLENPYATSFVVFDRYGSAVACALTMNNLFGTGRFATGTGVLLAAYPAGAGRGPTSLGPMMVVNETVERLFFAAASSGGVAAPTSMVNVAARTLLAQEPLDAAMQAKRIHHEGVPDITFFEHGTDDAVQKSLLGRGHRLARTPALGRVNAAYCGRGIPSSTVNCSILADIRPRGYGLAVSTD